MINFKGAPTRPQTAVVTEVPVVEETVTIKPILRPQNNLPAMPKPNAWKELRDYVVGRIEEIHGPFPRDTKKETTIFMAFMARWVDQAMAIAEYAFEHEGGFWKGSPVSINRFHRTSDSYFAEPIAHLIKN